MTKDFNTSPTGRFVRQPEPNMQSIPIRTPEGAKIRVAFTNVDNSEHILNWAINSVPHYDRLVRLHRRRIAGGLGAQSLSSMALNAVHNVYGADIRSGDLRGLEITPADLLNAARLFLAWEPEA